MKLLSLLAITLFVVSCGNKPSETGTSSMKSNTGTLQVTPSSSDGLVTPPVPKMSDVPSLPDTP